MSVNATHFFIIISCLSCVLQSDINISLSVCMASKLVIISVPVRSHLSGVILVIFANSSESTLISVSTTDTIMRY